ncbi:methyltransferase domain-containing protein [Microbacterium ulmi]|uniref:Methyltransferase domain-containing protein n=1 Tax=Microbacterium ulmi TaxID=179095 RepID=A0A7Y2LYE6_9MICO|nr:methyltransferase domain-containing protein [Microbacterium ulmi]NII68329.1 ubiquinone/menaquinone biosynthesis C-methylase UbiE [Microbacterium ulmi]NNH03136.1 methyltransferase domain-containing protein [Microbacterium ulmi]
MAEAYTHGHHDSVLRSHEWRTAENSAAYLLPRLRPGLRVLDVGAGPGTITIDLARLVAPGEVRGVDAAHDVVAKAAALAAERGIPNLTFAVDDAYALDAPDGAFDVVHAHQVLQHLARPVDALREFRRVLAPGGVVAVRDVDYEGVIWHPRVPALDEWLGLYLRVHRSVTGEPAAGRVLKAWARAAGFAEVEPSASVWLFESPGDRAWWGGMWADRVLHSAFARHARALGADDAALQRIADGWREWTAAEDGWILVPHGEVLAHG